MSQSLESNSPAESLGQPSRLAAVGIVTARLIFGGVTLAMVLSLFARWSVLAEILTHFRVVYLFAALAALSLAILARQWRLTSICALLLAWILVGIAPWYMRSKPAEAAADGATIKILTANVSVRNETKERMVELIERENPDLVFVQELNQQWSDVLANTYPYKAVSDRKDFFGLGFYSRYPIENIVMADPIGWDVPLMRADVIVDGQRIHVINAHLSPPEGGSLTQIRLVQYPWLTDYVATADAPLLIAGDLNCTMWSPLYKDLVKSGHLTSAREGRGIMASWLPLGGSLYLLPLDHVLARGLKITDARLADSIGSDHCPLVAELRLPTS